MTAPRRAIALLAPLACIAVLGACAAADESTPPSQRPAREYRTGSNIPVKDPAPPLTDEERRRQQDEIRRIQNSSASDKPKN